MLKAMMRAMTELTSRKALSRITGAYAKSKASRIWIRKFAQMYHIRIEDAAKPIEQYRTLNDFFTRQLKPGLRPIDPDNSSLVSPVDALITGIGTIKSGQLLNIKGQDYTIQQLLHQSPRTESYKHGYFFVLYLSPTDYHRIHAPIAGQIVESEHIPGRVYPVNEFGLRHMRTVLSRNERLSTYIRGQYGEVAVVKVGAMNVSSIQYVQPLPEQLAKGAELAYFEFGSTVVLLIEDGTFTPRNDLLVNSKVKMGEALGQLHAKP